MGRQSHLARLALGRSPFDLPLQDEQGEFILGPNAQHDTRRDYVQDFDSRGHPRNLASQISRRRLLRAQNEALSTVGVVVRKAKASRTRWQTMTDQAKFELVVEENTTGAYLGIVESMLQKLSTHWILNFRRRVLTYKSHLGLPIPQLILSEWNTVGPRAFLFTGLIPSAVSRISRCVRTAITEEEPFPRRPSHSSNLFQRSEIVKSLRYASLQMFWFALEYPFYAYSVLQALFLLPAGFNPSFLPSIPFKDVLSPTINPTEWSTQTWSSLASFILRDFRHPFVLALLRDRISSMLFPKVYVWIRELLVKPNRPDGVSLQSASAQLHMVPGKFATSTARRLARGEGTVKGLLGRWLSNILWFSLTVLHTQRVAMAIELSPEIEEELLERSNAHYHALVRQDRERGVGQRSTRTLRVMSIRAAFHEFNLDPDSSMVDIFELADEMSLSASSPASTSTPEPRDELTLEPPLQPQDENLGAPMGDTERQWVLYGHSDYILEQEEGGSTRPPLRNSLADGPAEPIDGTTFPELEATSVVVPAAGDLDAQAQSFESAAPSETPSQSAPNNIGELPVSRPASAARLSDIVELPAEPDEVHTASPVDEGASAADASPNPNPTNGYPENTALALSPEVSAILEDNIGNVAQVSQSSPFQPAVPLQTLLEPAPPGIEDFTILEALSPLHLSRAETPTEAIRERRRTRPASSQAASSPVRQIVLSPAPSSPPLRGIHRAPRLPAVTAPLRPIRRPTISDQHVPNFREEVARRARDGDYRNEPDPSVNANATVNTYRVTILSNHAAEAFAYHATSLLEAIILLPLDVMFARSLAANFLAPQHPPSPVTPLRAVTSPSIRDIWPLGLMAQMRDLSIPQGLHFFGNFLVTVGVQGLVNLGIWALGTVITLRFGERFGWGRI